MSLHAPQKGNQLCSSLMSPSVKRIYPYISLTGTSFAGKTANPILALLNATKMLGLDRRYPNIQLNICIPVSPASFLAKFYWLKPVAGSSDPITGSPALPFFFPNLLVSL